MIHMESTEISDQQAQSFLDNGYVILRGVIAGEELRRLRDETDELVKYGSAQVRADPDFSYGRGHVTGEQVLRRIEYVLDKSDACKVLLGHPFILRSVEKLCGKDFIPTWDSMVIKVPGQGIVVPWHRDAGTQFVGDTPIFNVDFYLDEADEKTCVWLIPGSHKWSVERTQEEIDRRNSDFSVEGAVPALMQPGDVLLHDILVLHGSPANSSNYLRRVIYYEFRTARVESDLGPHLPSYIPLKQRVLLNCIELRSESTYVNDMGWKYAYDPQAPHDTPSPKSAEMNYRFPHEEYWRQ